VSLRQFNTPDKVDPAELSTVWSLRIIQLSRNGLIILLKMVDTDSSYGRRLIPQILDRLAVADPERIVYSIASFSDGVPTFQHITAHAFARAVDKTAWWLHKHVNEMNGALSGDLTQEYAVTQKSPKIQALGYIGPRK
jgi:hypothetical protein